MRIKKPTFKSANKPGNLAKPGHLATSVSSKAKRLTLHKPDLQAIKGRAKSLKKPSIEKLRRKTPEQKISQAIENLPRITNETVAEHREEMLSSARKFIYPLKHSRVRIVKISVSLFAVGLVLFFGYVLLSLYRFQGSSTFMYGVTRVLPFPVGKAGDNWVSYESYLFELRHLKHYYETQQNVDFSIEKDQLKEFKQQAMDQVMTDAYVKQLAKQQKVSVTQAEVDDQVRLLREQNRLGNSEQEFADVLREFWGWDISDFRREVAQQLLSQKVVASMDTQAWDRIRTYQAQLQNGTDFATVAKQSDDITTKDSSGEYGFLIDRSSRDVAPKVVDALFRLQPGQTSGIIDTGYTLELVKLLSMDNGKARAAHIAVNYKPIETFVKPLRDKEGTSQYVSF
jgi:hypothetical protein